MTTADELRGFMRRVPAGVSVLTVDTGREQLGLTVSSFVSLSLEPALVGFAINRDAAMHELLCEAGAFAVNLLAGGQEWLAQHFARGVPPIAMWTGVETEEGSVAPLLVGVLGSLECRLVSDQDAGDHSFFVGAVERVRPGPPAPPLVYYDGEYRTL